MVANNKIKPKIGEVFGKLKIIEIFQENNLTKLRCLCECGQSIVSKYGKLRSGDQKSCGCLFKSLQPKPLVIGDRFGKLIYLGESNKKANDRVLFGKYQCDCGKIIETANTSVRQGKTNTCGCGRISVEVGKTYNRLMILEITNKRHCNGSVIIKCKCSCGNICYKNATSVKHGRIKSCGCLVKEINIKLCSERSGPNHYKWKQDRSLVDVRTRHRMRNFTTGVMTRDNFICQKCLKRGGNLVAHHLDGYHWCKEKRQDIDNGITLCKECHFCFHKSYGFNNNTKSQFLEFMEQ